jgi:hypothetical protein
MSCKSDIVDRQELNTFLEELDGKLKDEGKA